MAKQVLLLGPENSGKTFFLNAIAVTLEKNDIGFLENLHPEIGRIIDFALAEVDPQITPTVGIHEYRIKLGGRSYIALKEASISNTIDELQKNELVAALGRSNCVVVFIGSKDMTDTNIDNVGLEEERDRRKYTSVQKIIEDCRKINPILLKEVKPWWKIFRKMKHVIFITTNAAGKDPEPIWFEQNLSKAMPEVMKYLIKRKIVHTFHTLEIVREGGGINTEDVKSILDEILRAINK